MSLDLVSKYDRIADGFAEQSYANLQFDMRRRFVISTTYDWRLNCHLSDASCDCDEEPDAEDHEKGKRGSGL